MRFKGVYLFFLFCIFCFQGCFYLAPLDDDIIEKDFAPSINIADIRPQLGTVNINLESSAASNFVVKRISDPNNDQVLYWRAVVDYGTSILATNPSKLLPNQRTDGGIQFKYSPCSEPYKQWADEGGVHSLYIVVSDSPFTSNNQFYRNDNLSLAFKVEGNRDVAVVQWSVRLEGICSLVDLEK